MKPFLIKYFYLVVLIPVFICSCAEEGDVGPQGAKGDQGTQGDQGEQGEQGEPGTANVIYSDWISFDAADWTLPSNFFGQMRRTYPIEEAAITESILNAGTVAVYVKFTGTATIIQPLPVEQPITQTKSQVLNHNIQLGMINLLLFNQDDILDPGTIGTGNSYRYVIIPGGTPTGGRGGRIAGVDLSNYQEVKVFYNIPD